METNDNVLTTRTEQHGHQSERDAMDDTPTGAGAPVEANNPIQSIRPLHIFNIVTTPDAKYLTFASKLITETRFKTDEEIHNWLQEHLYDTILMVSVIVSQITMDNK